MAIAILAQHNPTCNKSMIQGCVQNFSAPPTPLNRAAKSFGRHALLQPSLLLKNLTTETLSDSSGRQAP